MLDWLYTPIAWLLEQCHALFATFLDPAGGGAWALAVLLLVVVVRSLLVPLAVSQMRSYRAAQALQPEVDALRVRYGEDARGAAAAVLALQREHGVSPLPGCLPALLQAPVFLALLHVLRRISPDAEGRYSWSGALTRQAAEAEVLGAPLASSFTVDGSPAGWAVALLLMVAMSLTSYLTQRLVQRRSGPVQGPAATVQGLLLYGMPLTLFASGFLFPIGVLLYWTASNLWTLAQQLVLLRRFPPPAPAAAPARPGGRRPPLRSGRARRRPPPR